MKRIISLFLVLFICFGLMAGCTQKPVDEPETTVENVTDNEPTDEPSKVEADNSALAQLRKSISNADCEVGVAFIGYVDSEGDEAMLKDYLKSSATASKYPFISDYEPIAHEGAELYALVPASEDSSITVYQSGMSDNGEYENYRDKVVYKGEKGEAIVLRCNLSEIFSNVLIEVNDLEFHPIISLKDGTLAEEKGCYDFSV